MKIYLIPVIVILSFISLAACDDGGGKKAPTLALEDVQDAYLELFCEKIESCEFSAFFDVIIEDRQGCVAFLKSRAGQEIGIADLIAAVEAGTIIYDGAAAHACLEAMRGLSCAAFGNAEPTECQDTFTGTIAHGGACHLGEECQSGNCDQSAGCPGVCRPAVPEGSACEDSGACVAGTKCVLDECTAFSAPVAEGGACDPDEDWCDTGLFCHPTSGECTARLAVGAACENVHELECEQGALCIGMGQNPKECVELVVVETVGGVCDFGAGAICAAYDDLSCAIDDFQAFTGTCQISKKLGEVCFDSSARVLTLCDPTADLYCDLSAGFQVDGACAAKKADGAACTDNDHCLSGWCDEEVCGASEEPCRP
jgi:hypothetical protein